jgi:transcription elongation GreA/GreB family factor
MARALLGKSVDDEITVHSPGGDKCYVIIAVGYDG